MSSLSIFPVLSNHSLMIFVTGGSGLVGSQLIKKLDASGNKVKALYHHTKPDDGYKNVEWVQGDIADILFLEEVLQGIEQVYHCAAIVSFNPKDKKEMYETNVKGTANMVNAAISAGIKKFLFVSSVSALGRLRYNEMVNESMQWSTETSNSEYGHTKFLSEMEVWRGEGEGLETVIVNPTIILGPADWNKGSSAIFKNVYHEFPWYSEGVTGYADVKDVVNAMLQLMNSDIHGEKFILSAVNKTYRELFILIAKEFGKKHPYKEVTPFLAAIVWRLEALKSRFTGKNPLITKETAATAQAKVFFDNSKLLKFLPSFSYTPFEETIKRVCAEYKVKYNLS